MLEHLKSQEVSEAPGAMPKKKVRRCKWIEPIAQNFKRTKNGSKLIQQQIKTLLDRQKTLFAVKPMLNDPETEVRYNDCGEAKSIGTNLLLARAPYFFSGVFGAIRNKLHFGTKVQQWLQKVLRL